MGSNVVAGSLAIPSPITCRSSSVGSVEVRSDHGFPRVLNFPRGQARTRYSSASLCSKSVSGGLKLDSQGVSERDGLIIVDHGSRRKESNLMLNEFVAMFRDKTGYPIVEPAHMELAEPSIKDTFGLCVQRGALRVIVSPFFLFPGRHWHKDIPALTAEAAKEHPGVPYIVTAPLGLHELLVKCYSRVIGSLKGIEAVGQKKDVVNDRIKHCLSHVAGDADECAACAGTGKCRVY